MGVQLFLQLCALMCLSGFCLAGPLGKEFVTAFMQNYLVTYSNANFQLFITAYSPQTNISVYMNKSGFAKVLTVNERTTAIVQIPAYAELPGTGLSDHVVLIKADKDISILSLNFKLESADTSIVYPVQDLGMDYYVVTPLDGPTNAYKEFAVVNYQDLTKVDIFLKGAVTYQGNVYTAGSKLSVDLDPYRALQLLSRDDLSGTRVVSQKPVAVLSGHTCSWKNTRCNHVYEQLLPVPSWGSSFIIPPVSLQVKSDLVFVVASSNNTKIDYQVGSRKLGQTLNAGQTVLLEVPVKTALYLNASANIQVIYYCTGWFDKSQVQFDPFLMTIPPISRYCSSYLIYGQKEFDNYGTVVAKTADVSKVSVNKSAAQDLTWTNIPGSEYSWTIQPLGKGFSARFDENTSPFLLLSFGFARVNGYGSPAICLNGLGQSCSTIKCRAKETCQMVNGNPVCTPLSEALCHTAGDPHYRTFDGYVYDFQGTCTYTVAKTCSNDSSLTNFNIEAKNENRGNTLVSYVGYITIQVYDQIITLVRYEHGFVRVNYQRQRLPININNGQVRLYQSGGSVVIGTDFFLRVEYDWNSIIRVSISSSYFGSVCGLCGNYNGNPSDDLMMQSGIQARNLVEFGKSWKVEDGDKLCWHDCHGECKPCPSDTQKTYKGEDNCGLLSILDGPFIQCNSVIDPKTYIDNCVYDLCMNTGSKQILCQSLKTYAEACQRGKVNIGDWRSFAGCPLQCPSNSDYTLCSKACPATCNDNATVCSDSCVESCQCRQGFVLDGGQCVTKDHCGCIYQGKIYAPNETFWGDTKCQQLCTCNPNTKNVECKASSCKSSETCSVVNGIQNCYSVSYGTCVATGDPHYITFDGLRYNFQGTCIYQLVALCNTSADLVDFQVNVQNEFRGSKVVSYTSAVQIELYGFQFAVSRLYRNKILINGLLSNLPYVINNGKLSIYKQGNFAVLQTSFGLRVTYNWNGYASVTLPSSYAGSVCGLCGNFDGKKGNDFTTKNNQMASSPVGFGSSWKVQDVPGCYEASDPSCTKLADLELRHTNGQQGCGMIKEKSGPFRECQAKINPDDYFKSCLYDVCFYENREDVICQVIASYAARCQEAGVTIYPWRTSQFCSPVCPKNSHYKACASGCSPSCPSLTPPLGCNPVCSEGCQCDDGFVLSGGDCVAISECGCRFNNSYYKLGEVFYPSSSCTQKCVCMGNGAVDCQDSTCGANEVCKVVDGVRKCQPMGSAQCSRAGDPHYMSFDGRSFDFQGNCTYTLSKTVGFNENLEPFAINVKNEKWGNGLVSVTKIVYFLVYGYNITLRYNVPGRIMVDGVYNNMPATLEDGKIRVYQNGKRVIVDTDFGVRVNYDLVYHVMVTVPGNYKNQLGGLCGNYNGNTRDDFQLPNKTVTTDATAFGASWKVPVPGVACDSGCGGTGNPCPTCDNGKKEILKTDYFCGFLKKVRGPLSACYNTISPDTYFNNCVYDLCAGAGDGDILCQSIHSYVAACQAAGVTIQPWRTVAFCPMTCPANSTYKLCADVCSATCVGITDPAICPETCSEGCQCNDNFFFDGKNCVSMDNCGCFEDGKYYQPNEKVLSSDCNQTCTCRPVGSLVCDDIGCAADQECKIQDGVVKCVYQDPCRSIKCRVKEKCKVLNGNAVCVPDFKGSCWGWGDPHYRTFDGYTYDFQGTCTYVLTKYDRDDLGLVPFSIEEKNDNRGSQAVSYVRIVSIYTYGYKISLVKGERGKVRVNDLVTNLPVTLLDGKISVGLSGSNAVVHTDFGLQMTYEYDSHVVITLPSSYSGLTRGLCGNFNQNHKDELVTSDSKMVSSVIDWAKSWKVNDQDPFCFDSCPSLNCPTCDDTKRNLYGDENKCGLIKKVANGPFKECHPKVDPDNFFDSCLYDVCMNGGANRFLCQALSVYANTCRNQGVKVYDWRTLSGCVLSCPANSHYEFCGTACPATCTDHMAPSRCTDDCVETCQCDDGFVLSGDKCVPTSSCGCSYNGAYYQANQEFWADENCHVLCKCDSIVGFVVCKESSCKPSEQCVVANGVLGCQPVSFSTCISSGDPHYTTFDGKKYDFMGTCIYQLVDVSNSLLNGFNVRVQNNNRGGNKAVSTTKIVTLEVYNTNFTLSMDYPRRILVNGLVASLPFYFQTNKVVAYINGRRGILKTDFYVTVAYDWDSYAAVTIPSTYANAVQGLCGNNNKSPADDFTMKDGKSAANAVVFGNSWKVGDVAGCSPECTVNCPVCTDAQKKAYVGDNYCGLITKPRGPFALCAAVIDPMPYFNDCIYDSCQYKGHPSSFCKAIALYVAACQAVGVKIQEWRNSTFCSMSCPPNTHYKLCGNACLVTCYGLSSPTGCDSPCEEACYCDNGFILSGDKCVPIRDCGCVYQDKYYQKNEVFYPLEGCNQMCQCGNNGMVVCQSRPCRPEEECKLFNGALKCRPKKYGRCVASGDTHYITFDGLKYDFQGTCTYNLATVVVADPTLANFSVIVENESYGNGGWSVTKLVVIQVYGYTVAIKQAMTSKVKVNGEFVKLPLSLEDDRIVVNQEGVNVVLQTDFGLKVLYDTIYHVIVNISSSYRGKMGGLCGNFNGDDTDEFQLPNGQVVRKVVDFGASWKVNNTGAKCCDDCKVQSPGCDAANLQQYSTSSSCGMMTSTTGPFRACHAKVNPKEYFNHCTYDSCAVGGGDNTLCKSLQAYAAACQSVGVAIDSWRTSAFCPLTCPANSTYSLCTRTCEQTCFSLSAPTKCTEECFEGCDCDAGFALDGDTCVPVGTCGCAFNGRYLSEDDFFVSADCSQQCKCQGGGVTCSAMSCKEHEQCSLVNGVQGCRKPQAECSLSQQQFVTFDGLSGALIGSGPVEVISLCNRNSSRWFRVIADVQSCVGAPAFVARLHIFILQGLVTVSKNKAVWVSGRPDVLPVVAGILSASVKDNLISVQIGDDLNIELSGSGSVTIRVSESLAGVVCGACGNYNSNPSDDLQSPTGQAVTNVADLLKSYIAQDFSSCMAG